MSNEIPPPITYEGRDKTVTLTFNSYLEAVSALSFRVRESFEMRHNFGGNFWRAKTRQYIRAMRELRRAA